MTTFFNNLVNAFAQYDLMVVDTQSTLNDLEHQLRCTLMGRHFLSTQELITIQQKALPYMRTALASIEKSVHNANNYKNLPGFLMTWHQRRTAHKIALVNNLLANLEIALGNEIAQLNVHFA